MAYRAAVRRDREVSSSNDDDNDNNNDDDDKSADDATADLFPDPVPFIALARECDLRVILATILYSLCCDSSSRKKKLSHLKREDSEAFMLGRERMMSFICGPAALELGIHSWEIENTVYYHRDDDRVVCCRGRTCHIPAMKAWLDIVQDAVCQGDPLKTLRSYSQKFRQYMEDHIDDVRDDYEDYEYGEYNRADMCVWCHERLADGLDDLRSTLFDILPSFFAPII